AVGRWRKFDEALSPAGKRPVLFVMCENTQAADEAGDYLRQRAEFAGDRLLVIHTNRQGEITKADLDLARQAAREVDQPGSRIRCIVSVLMLREGWDVRNVCVIVTLRSLTAKAKILPEQALGRGLRRVTPPGSGHDERVVVKRIFIGFAVEDKQSRDLLRGQSKLGDSPIDYTDMSVKQPWDSSWKTKCRERIKSCDGFIALLSKNVENADGARWEIKCAVEEGVPVLGVHFHQDDNYTPPEIQQEGDPVDMGWDRELDQRLVGGRPA
ncbi:MAG: TIR domain-containing protein, partial [Thermoleophilaceae bacterium]